ncbi:hypothetical protein [Anabaena azotica]|uniref:Uncharacterized protein n=1 Tax=Anabaena azotica FACHB-119 TaxID=947527 RepID=A0ABR8DAQ0_9NOST|nr:hypothetical protein [Anabaena azotica]MBD2504194.1 hypothetical protein [Anabaena azotica FACHB-119]
MRPSALTMRPPALTMRPSAFVMQPPALTMQPPAFAIYSRSYIADILHLLNKLVPMHCPPYEIIKVLGCNFRNNRVAQDKNLPQARSHAPAKYKRNTTIPYFLSPVTCVS